MNLCRIGSNPSHPGTAAPEQTSKHVAKPITGVSPRSPEPLYSPTNTRPGLGARAAARGFAQGHPTHAGLSRSLEWSNPAGVCRKRSTGSCQTALHKKQLWDVNLPYFTAFEIHRSGKRCRNPAVGWG